MATTNQLVDRIKRRLSRPNVTAYDTTIIDELNATKEWLESRATLPDFITKNLPVIFGVGVGAVTFEGAGGLVTDFIRWTDDNPMRRTLPAAVDGETFAPVERFVNEEELIQRWAGSGAPRGWVYTYPTLVVRPKPEVSTEIVTKYYFRDSALVAGNTTVWTTECAHLMVAHTGLEVAQQLRDKDAMTYFSGMRKEAYADYIKRLVAKEMAGLSTSRGED